MRVVGRFGDELFALAANGVPEGNRKGDAEGCEEGNGEGKAVGERTWKLFPLTLPVMKRATPRPILAVTLPAPVEGSKTNSSSRTALFEPSRSLPPSSRSTWSAPSLG